MTKWLIPVNNLTERRKVPFVGIHVARPYRPVPRGPQKQKGKLTTPNHKITAYRSVYNGFIRKRFQSLKTLPIF